MTHNQSSDDRAPGASPHSPDGHGASTQTNAGNPLPVPNEQTRALPPEALRALAEAEDRRRASDAQIRDGKTAVELGGRSGPEPTRYGDWEKGGIVSDF